MTTVIISGSLVAIDYDRRIGITGTLSVSVEYTPAIEDDIFIERKLNVQVSPVVKLAGVGDLTYAPIIPAFKEPIRGLEYTVIDRKKVKANKGPYIGQTVFKETRKYHEALNKPDESVYIHPAEDETEIPEIVIPVEQDPVTERERTQDDIITLRPLGFDGSITHNLDRVPYLSCSDLKNVLANIRANNAPALAEFDNTYRAVSIYNTRYRRIQQINRSQGLEINGGADGVELHSIAMSSNNEQLKITMAEFNNNEANLARIYELVELASSISKNNRQMIGSSAANLRTFLSKMNIPEKDIVSLTDKVLAAFAENVKKQIRPI